MGACQKRRRPWSRGLSAVGARSARFGVVEAALPGPGQALTAGVSQRLDHVTPLVRGACDLPHDFAGLAEQQHEQAEEGQDEQCDLPVSSVSSRSAVRHPSSPRSTMPPGNAQPCPSPRSTSSSHRCPSALVAV
jgi:hypothetical protein